MGGVRSSHKRHVQRLSRPPGKRVEELRRLNRWVGTHRSKNLISRRRDLLFLKHPRGERLLAIRIPTETGLVATKQSPKKLEQDPDHLLTDHGPNTKAHGVRLHAHQFHELFVGISAAAGLRYDGRVHRAREPK